MPFAAAAPHKNQGAQTPSEKGFHSSRGSERATKRRTSMNLARISRSLCGTGLLVLALMTAATLPARAETDAAKSYPNRVIRMVVGFAAGGGNDIFARLVGQKLQDVLGQTVIIENKPGAGGRLASEFVANKSPDGYTLLVGATGAMSIAAAIYPDLRYHPTKSFVPLAMIANFPLFLVVSESSPVKSVKELVDWAKVHPDKANYATTSPTFTITSELLKLKTGMPGVAVPYRSAGEIVVSVMSEQTMFGFVDGPPAIPMVNGGKVRALAVTGSERSDVLPNVPAMSEIGFPEVDVQIWSGVFAPAKTPPAIVKKLEAALQTAMQDPNVRSKLKAMGVNPGGSSGDEFRRMIDVDIRKYVGIVKAADLKFDE
jgi:tripartite-type tricarboxylate transporter receptor subunit TctC